MVVNVKPKKALLTVRSDTQLIKLFPIQRELKDLEAGID